MSLQDPFLTTIETTFVTMYLFQCEACCLYCLYCRFNNLSYHAIVQRVKNLLTVKLQFTGAWQYATLS